MLKRLVILAALSGFLLSTEAAQAASACKGISSGKCDGAVACYWVKGYKTKKGTTVSAHCRAKPKSGAKSSKKKNVSVDKSAKKAASDTSGKKASSKKTGKSTKKKTTDKKKKKNTKKKKEPTS